MSKAEISEAVAAADARNAAAVVREPQPQGLSFTK
jgi:hypothetical protein